MSIERISFPGNWGLKSMPAQLHPFDQSIALVLTTACICEAACRPSMRYVAPKTEAQQTLSVLHRMRDALVRERTQATNQAHGFLLEFGISLPKGLATMKRLPS